MRHSLITLYIAIVASLLYLSYYGIITSFLAGSFTTESVFGETKAALIIANTSGYVVGKLLGIKYVSETSRQVRFRYMVIIYVYATLLLVVFGAVSPFWQVVIMFIWSVPQIFVWGFVIAYVEGRRATEIIIMVIYMVLIMASGITKSMGTLVINAGISENWMPLVCASGSLVLCVPLTYLLDRAPEPTEEEKRMRQNREPCTLEQQKEFINKYKVGLGCITIAYGFLAGYRGFRDFYALELWEELLTSNFDANIFTISEVIVSITVTCAYCLIFFVKSEKNGFFVLLGMMITGATMLITTTIVYSISHFNAVAFVVLTGTGVLLAYIPPGAMLFDKLMGATQTKFTSVFMMLISEFIASSTTLIIIILKSTIYSEMSYVAYYITLSYVTGTVVIVSLVIAIITFYRKLHE